MTPQQREIVQSSFDQTLCNADNVAAMFYDRLFTLRPDFRPLFTGDMEEQGRKLMKSLTFIVKGLDRLEAIAPAARELGRRHIAYGVHEEDYAVVGEALLWTLKQELGETFTAETEQAWIVAYSLIAETMKEVARQQLYMAA